MIKIKQASISIAVASLLLTSLAPVAVAANEFVKSDLVINTVEAPKSDMPIGEQITNHKYEKAEKIVTEVRNPENSNRVLSATIPDGLYVDGLHTFHIAEALVTGYDGPGGNIVIPDGVIGIGVEAFADKQLTSVVFPESLQSIGVSAFNINQITEVNLPNSLVEIGENAFNNNELTSVTFPESVTDIGAYAFSNNKLTSITLPQTLTEIGDCAFIYNELKSLVVPEGVTTIGENAFNNNQITSVVLPQTLQNIGAYAFSNNQLTNVEIPDGVTVIANSVFSNNKLTSVALPQTLTSIGNNTFRNNQLINLVIPEGVTTVGENAFVDNQLGTLTLPPTLTDIGAYAFYNNKLTSVEIPEAVTIIESSVFGDNKLTSVTLPQTLTSIGKNSFRNNELTSVEIPEGVTTVGENAFVDNQLGTLTLPQTLTSIGAYAFYNNQLTQIIIPEKIEEIGSYSFTNNQTLERVVFKGNYPKGWFGGGWLSANNMRTITIIHPNTASWGNITDNDIINDSLNVKINRIPWNQPTISGLTALTLQVNQSANLLEGVKAKDSQNNDITDKLEVGTLDTSIPGVYEVVYNVKDQYGFETTLKRGVTILVEAESDWKNHWAAEQIQEAMQKDWVLTTNQFRPNDDVTRAEFIKIINRAFGFTTKASNEPFTDVNNSHWWYDEVKIAIKAGYISTSQATFRPTDPITREEAATIIARIKKIEDTNHDKIKKYSDYKKVASWAINGVEGVIEKGYMGQGITAFRPKDNITRAEAVVTISRVNNPTGIETSFRGAVISADNKLEIASHISYNNNVPVETKNVIVTLVPHSNGNNVPIEEMINIDSLIKKITIPIDQLQLNQEYLVMVAINDSQEQLWMGNIKTFSYQSGKNKIIVTNKNNVLTIKREQVAENTGKIKAVSIHGEDLGIDTNYLSANSLILFKDAVQTNEVALVSKNNVKKLSNTNKGIDVSKLVDGKYQIAVKDSNGIIHNLASSQEKNTQYTAYTVRRNNKLKEVIVDATKGKYPTLTIKTKAANSTNVVDVMLDPGHGGDYNPGVADSGACSPIAGVACEHTEMLNLMKMVRQGLENHGLKVAMTREMNYAGGKLPLYGNNSRTDKVYNSGAKVTIASHYNSAGSSNRGAFAMHAMQDTNELANKIISNLSSQAKQPKDLNQHTACDVMKKTGDGTSYGYDHATPTSDCYYMVREYGGNITNGKNKDAKGNFYRDNYRTAEPVLVEYFNGANSADANNFKNNKAQYANSVVKAIVEYFGITYKKTLVAESLELYELDTYNYEAIDNLK